MRYWLPLFLLLATGANGANMLPWDTGFETGNQKFTYYHSDEPVAVVTGDAAEGNSSLQVDLNTNWLRGHWFYSIKKDTDYTFSFYAKRISGGDTIRFLLLSNDWKYWVGSTTIPLTDQWKRYSCTFRMDAGGVAMYPAILQVEGREPAVFRVDAMQLEEGKSATPYRAGEPFSVYPTVGPAEIAYTPGPPRMTVRLHNDRIDSDRFTLRVRLPDATREKPFQLARGKTTAETLELPEAAAVGYYPVTVEILDASGKTVKSAESPFVVTEPFPQPAKPGFFGMQEGQLPNCHLHLIGATRLRKHSLVGDWKWLEPKEGEFRKLSLKRPDSLFWHLLLSGEFLAQNIPEWGLRPDGRKADLAKAAIYLDQLFRQYRGKTEVVEFLNEPYLAFRNYPDGADYYAELLQIAAPIAHKYGLKLMADTESGPFWDAVWKKAGNCVDVCSSHPYCAPRVIMDDGRYVASPEKGQFVAVIRAESERAQRNHKEFVVGELGYSMGESIPFDAPAARLHASFLARMLLIARSYPDCRYLIWFTGLDHWEAGPYLYGIWRTEDGIRPLPSVAAYAQAVHELDHADEVKWILNGDIKILSFRKNGRTGYAVWDATDSGEPLPLALPEGSDIRSLYGTPLASTAITGAPFYVSENEAGTVLPALRAAVESRPPLTIRGYLRSADTLKLLIRNRSFKEWSGTLAIEPFYRSGKLTVAPNSQETLTVKPDREFPDRFRIEAENTDGKSFEQAMTVPPMYKVRRLKVADLETFDFLREPGLIEQSKREDVFPPDPQIPWKGAEDLSHRTLPGWDENNFYLFSEVRDDVHWNPHGDSESWAGDSLQIGIDSFNDADGKPSYDSDDHEFTFALDKKPWSHQGPPNRKTPDEAAGVRQFITRNEEAKTTTYRIAIPRQLLSPLKLREGTVFGLGLCVNDEDPGEARYHMNFGNGIGEAKCPALFKKLMLVK